MVGGQRPPLPQGSVSERERERERESQTDRQRQRQTETDRDRERCFKQRDRDRERCSLSFCLSDRKKERDRQSERERRDLIFFHYHQYTICNKKLHIAYSSGIHLSSVAMAISADSACSSFAYPIYSYVLCLAYSTTPHQHNA